MNYNKLDQQGFSLIELMIGTLIGLILSLAIMEIYLSQSQLYKASNSQALIQSTENAISNLVTPVIRSAGFTGCSTIATAISNLNAGGPRPIGIMNTTPTMIMGYNGGTSSMTLTANPTNSGSASDWSPALDATLVGSVEKGSDVLVVLGSAVGGYPLGLTAVDLDSSSLTLQSAEGTNITAGQFAAVSDCAKTAIFQITGVTGTNISHNAGSGILQNANSEFPVSFQVGSQFVLLQQTAFFVGQGQGGQSALMRATLVGNNWSVQPIVPGVALMKVQYGIGTNGIITQYIAANAVPNWAQVYAVRIGFIIEGQPGSGTSNTTQFTVMDIPVTVPADNRLRHVYEITINLRNALS